MAICPKQPFMTNGYWPYMQPCATPVLLLITQKIAHSLLIEVNEVETGKSNWRKEFNLKSTNLLGLYALLRKGSKAWLKSVED